MLEQRVRRRLDPRGDFAFRRPAVRGVVLEAAVMRRIVRGRDDDAISHACLCAHGCSVRIAWETAGVGVYSSPSAIITVDPVGRQYLERTGTRRHGERMRVHAEKQRAIDRLLRAIQADGLTDGQDVVFVERRVEGGPAMARGAERHPLPRHRRIRAVGVVGRDELRHVHQHRWRGRLACKRAHGHGGGSRSFSRYHATGSAFNAAIILGIVSRSDRFGSQPRSVRARVMSSA